jgi:hypothetical protein
MLRRDPAVALAEADSSLVGPANRPTRVPGVGGSPLATRPLSAAGVEASDVLYPPAGSRSCVRATIRACSLWIRAGREG